MFTGICRHMYFDWQITESFLYVIGKYNFTLTWTYIVALDI